MLTMEAWPESKCILLWHRWTNSREPNLRWLTFEGGAVELQNYIGGLINCREYELQSAQLRKLANDSLAPWTWFIKVEWIANSIAVKLPSLICNTRYISIGSSLSLNRSIRFFNFDRPGSDWQGIDHRSWRSPCLMFRFSLRHWTLHIILKLWSIHLRKSVNEGLAPWSWFIKVEWIANSIAVKLPSLITYNACCMLYTAYFTRIEALHFVVLVNSGLERQTFAHWLSKLVAIRASKLYGGPVSQRN